jgi:protein-S-isoprenylcysteine O-methyltransferase
VTWLDPVVLLTLVWVVGEVMLIWRRRPSAAEGRGRDRGSFGLIMLAMYLSVGTGVILGRKGLGALPAGWYLPLHYGGALLIAVGLALRWAAIYTLGRFFTVKVAVLDGHRVIKEGPYRYIRHPSYAGALVSLVGLSLSYASWVTLMVVVVPASLAIAYRIHVEEAALETSLGEEYAAYRRQTARLIPGIY